ncbi:MAG: S8 family serine peptidase [Planctomycetes bacterium]|nr:S8 family serine peptidase [Planctomycetota bacterium]
MIAIPQIGVRVIELADQADEQAQLTAFRALQEVEYAELDRVYSPADVTPNDTWYFGQWHLSKIGAPAAWTMTTGSANVVIAICDTGVDPAHPDLVTKLLPGWNAFAGNTDTHDVTGHGTSVAGVAAAASNNGIGVASVAGGCPILPIRISDASGLAASSIIASGIVWAADHGARVVNVSYYGVNGDATVSSAAQYLRARGGIVITAAGNDGLLYSASDNPYLLCVGATGSNDVLATFSSRGNYVDVVAPGAGIFTTGMGGLYVSGTGTSFSAPIVAGVAALVISAAPSLTGNQVQDVLKQTTDDLGTVGQDTSYGTGRINAYRAVTTALSMVGSGNDTTKPSVGISSPVSGASVSGSVNVQVTATDNVGVASVSVYVDGGLLSTDTTSPFSFFWNTTSIANGVHSLKATAADAAGNTSIVQIGVIVNNTVIDQVSPSVVITYPQSGWAAARNQLSVIVLVNATDNVGVTRVELYVDGIIRATSTSSPFTTVWNLASSASGMHTLQCRAYDAAGNVGVSASSVVSK